MKQKDVLTKNNDFLNVMFRGTPCISKLPTVCKKFETFYYYKHFVRIKNNNLVRK